MTRYTLRALAAQWRAWSGTVAVLALAAGLVNVCLVHRMTVTRPDVVAAARAAGVDPAELIVPGVSVAFYTAMVTVPVVAVVGQSCVQALRTSWALWRLAGALPRQVLAAVLATVAVLGLVACAPGILLGQVAAQPFASVLTRLAAARMGRIEVVQTPTTLLFTVVVVVAVAVLGAVGPARTAVRTPAVEAVRDAASEERRGMGVGRRILAGLWVLVCAGQLLVAFLAPPGRKIDGWPTGGGQATLASLLLAVLRCAGSTVRGVCLQVGIEAGLYVGTALLISLVPLAVTTTGESLFYARAGLPLVVRPGVGPVLLVAVLSFLALVVVLLAPIRGATRAPIGTVLAAE